MSEKEYLDFLNSLDEDLIIDEKYFINKINIKVFHGNIKRIWKF